MAIIAVLVALLLPALARAREQARKAVCSANLYSLGMAHEAYTQDYNGFYFYIPQGTVLWNFPDYWPQPGKSDPLVKGNYTQPEVFYCPSYLGKMTTYGIDVLWEYQVTSYAHFVNCWYVDTAKPYPDGKCDSVSNVEPGQAMAQDLYVNATYGLAATHDKGVDVLFTDDHVEWVGEGRLTDSHHCPVHWYFPGYWKLYPDKM